MTYRRAQFWLLVLALCLASAACAVEVSPDVSTEGVPSLGVYQTEFLATHVNVDPDLTKGYQLLVDLRFEAALSFLGRCVETNSHRPRVASEASAYLGYAYINMRRSSEAIHALRRALQLDDKNALAHFFMAQEFFLDGERSQVREHLQTAVALRPTFVSALRMLAETYKDEGRGREAVATYQRIVALLPKSGYYRYQLYKACMDAAMYDQAEIQLRELIRLEPAYTLNYYRLGDVQLLLGHPAQAREQYERLEGVREFEYLARLGYAKVHMARGELDEASEQAQRAYEMSNRANQEAFHLLEDIQAALRERQFERLQGMATWGVAALLVGLLVALGRVASRRKYVMSAIEEFSGQLQEFEDQNELCDFLLDDLIRRTSSTAACVLLYNRFTNQLTVARSRGLESDELESMRIIVGNELNTWSREVESPVLYLRALTYADGFESVFPSLMERLVKAGFSHLCVLRDKQFFLGFVAVSSSVKKKEAPVDDDLMRPLLDQAAQALDTLILYETSVVDELTGLFNQRYFKQHLNVEVRRADRYSQPLSLITFDLDDFKKINDTYGHAYGDLVIRQMGDIVRQCVRAGIDTAARTGGEEFTIILPATHTERAAKIAERIRTATEEAIFEGFSRRVKVTISVGVATYPVHAGDAMDLVRKSDMAQYQAKKSGKNRVVTSDQVPRERRTPHRRDHVQLESRFDHLNILDASSGLYNFTYFSLRLKDEFRRTGRYPMPISLVVLRIDQEMDESLRPVVLQKVGAIVKESLREGIDTPARLDTDEVAIIVPETEGDPARALAERLKMLVESKVTLPGGLPPTLSVGVCSYPERARDEDHILQAALDASRRVHRAGGDAVLLSPPMPATEAPPAEPHGTS